MDHVRFNYKNEMNLSNSSNYPSIFNYDVSLTELNQELVKLNQEIRFLKLKEARLIRDRLNINKLRDKILESQKRLKNKK